jgi:tetratricopeptide (TPR) repeat protein
MDQLIELFNSGHYAELELQARQLLLHDPQSGFFWKVLSVALQMQGKDALDALLTASKLLPDDAEAYCNLGNALRDRGQLVEAAEQYRSALTLRPDSAETHGNLGNVLRDLGQHAEAATSLQRALQIKPGYAQAHYNLGIVMRELGQLESAIACYRQALAQKPDFAEAYNNLGIALRESEQLDEAISSFQQALQINPNYADAHYNLANGLNDLGRFDAAVLQYRQALKLRPNHAEALNNLGNALKDTGLLDEACGAYEAAIAVEPDLIAPQYSLSLLKTYSRSDPHLAMLEQQLPQVAGLPMEARIRFWFTLGKVREDMGLYDASFSAYQQGNQLQQALLKWDEKVEKAEEALFERVMSVFSRNFFAARQLSGHATKSPIFIVGMPRSGTSLLEQILSTYPGVHGAGELSDVSDVVTAAMHEGRFALFPEAVRDLSDADIRKMGEQYIERIWRHAPGASHVVDKMPANFFYLGMIHLMLPNAKIIHAMRDPMDSCFSCYSRLFINDNLGFTYDLEALGRYYVRYSKLMRHWHDILPPGTVLDMRYEELVADTETQARRLLAYLGLPWDANCMDFHHNKRQVKTASAAQVQKPIYRTSLARWERYADHLAPLLELVKEYRA